MGDDGLAVWLHAAAQKNNKMNIVVTGVVISNLTKSTKISALDAQRCPIRQISG
jgi:hypothetical protein